MGASTENICVNATVMILMDSAFTMAGKYPAHNML
jgi:hypothetical protein